MVITYLGKQFFKIQQGDTIIAFNPISKDSDWKGKISRFGAEMVLSTTNHPDYNGMETVTYGEKEPIVFSGPGDYEAKEIFVKGVGVPTTISGKNYYSTVYSLNMEGIDIAFLGPLTKKLEPEERDGIESPDILFVPISDEFLETSVAYKLAVSLEPGIIIPMEYDEKSLKAFLKEAGAEKLDALDKLVIKKKDLQDKQAEVVVLESVA
jgi:hypothetical protein